jgi:hypothetical protein
MALRHLMPVSTVAWKRTPRLGDLLRAVGTRDRGEM